MKIDSRIYRLKGLTPIMGSLPGSKSLRANWLAKHAPMPELAQEEIVTELGDDDRITVFNRNRQGQLCIMGYQVKGFFKSALYALRDEYRIAAYKTKVDLLLFAEPSFIPLFRDGSPIMAEDDYNERPLRTDGPKGARMCISCSEMVLDPWEVEVEISLLKDRADHSSPLNWEAVEDCLEYGAYHGLGQWRNAGYGRFLWVRADV